MKWCAFSDGSHKTDRAVLIGFVKIYATEQLAAKLELFLLTIKTFLGCAVQRKTASSKKIVELLESNMEERNNENFSSIFAVTAPPLFRGADTDYILLILRSPTAVQAYPVSDVRVWDCVLWLFRKKRCRGIFLNGSMFLQSILTTKKGSAKIVLPNSVLTTSKASLLFHGIGHVTERMADWWLCQWSRQWVCTLFFI